MKVYKVTMNEVVGDYSYSDINIRYFKAKEDAEYCINNFLFGRVSNVNDTVKLEQIEVE